MSASSVLSVIAPVVGAAPASLGAESEDVSAQFAAVLSETGETATEASSDVTAPMTLAACTQPAPKIETPKTAPAAFILALEDAVAEAPSADEIAVPPAPVAETSEVETSPETSDTPPAQVQDGDADQAPDAAPVAPPVTVPSMAAPQPSAAPTIQVPAEPAAAEDGAPPSTPPTTHDAPDASAETEPTPAAAAAETRTAKTAETAAAPQPLKAEPPRTAPVMRETRQRDAAAEPAQPVSETPKTGQTAAAATATARAPEPAVSSPPPALIKLSEIATAPRLDPATVNTAAAETGAHPALETAPSAPAVTASTLSRATIETTVRIAAQIAHRLEGKQTRFDMVLTPEDLGRVEVSLDIDADGRLAARLAFDNPAAAADLRGRADELRRQLTDAGFQLAGDSLEFSERDANAFSGGAFDRGQDRAFSFAGGKRLGDQADQAAAARPAAWINLSLTPDRVDMRV